MWPATAPPRPSSPSRSPRVSCPHEQLVQLHCLCIGRLSRTKGIVWQYTAIEVVSLYTWANLQVTGRNPSVT